MYRHLLQAKSQTSLLNPGSTGTRTHRVGACGAFFPSIIAAYLATACAGQVTPDEWEQLPDGGSPGQEQANDTMFDPTVPSAGSPSNHGTSNSGEPPVSVDTTSTTDEGSGGVEPVDVPGSTRIARLTHLQYDNTVRDLLYLEVNPSLEFPPDPVFGGYNNNANQLRVADRLGRDYRRSAEALAQAAVSDPVAYPQLMPCDSSEISCAAEFVADFGQRAYRRPLTDGEQQLYLDLFDQAPTLVASGDAFKDGVQLVIEAMLQSPKFLYRAELSTGATATGTEIALSDHELAQRLSYALWNTMPDQALLESAAQGELTAGGLLDIVNRMVNDPRARGPVSDFHFQWLRLSRYADLQRDPDSFPLFSSSLPMQEETLRFIEHIGFEQEKGFASLLTAPQTFVNRDLAALYGLSGDFGDELQLVDLDSNERGGLLTQIGFLAANAYMSETSPIHRGVFVNRTILCKDIPDPPSNLDIGEEAVDNPSTTREAVEQQTSPSACSGCHALINPAGFAFETYDAVGQVRTTDRGNPIDTTGQLPIDNQMVTFDNAKELIDAIAQSQEARTCFARNLLRYAYGRTETPADEALITELSSKMSSDDFSIKDALAELAQADAFVTRTPNQD